MFACSGPGFHLLMNRYRYDQGHGISFHDDRKDGYDLKEDPITSFLCRLGSLLIVIESSNTSGTQKHGGKVALVLYQPPGSILVMGGDFQEQFKLCLPTYAQIKILLNHRDGEMFLLDQTFLDLHWAGDSKQLMAEECLRIERCNLGSRADARWNMTLRWVRYHLQPLCQLL